MSLKITPCFKCGEEVNNIIYFKDNVEIWIELKKYYFHKSCFREVLEGSKLLELLVVEGL